MQEWGHVVTFLHVATHACRDRSRSRRRSHVAPSDSWFVGSGAAEAGEWFHSIVLCWQSPTWQRWRNSADGSALRIRRPDLASVPTAVWLPTVCKPEEGRVHVWMTLDTLQINSKNLLAKLLLHQCATEKWNNATECWNLYTQSMKPSHLGLVF